MTPETAITVGELTDMIRWFEPPAGMLVSNQIPFYAPDTAIHWASTSEIWRARESLTDWLSVTQGTLGFIDYLGMIDEKMHQSFHNGFEGRWAQSRCCVPLLHELRCICNQLPPQILIKNTFLLSEVEGLFHFWDSLPNPYLEVPIDLSLLEHYAPDLSLQGAAFIEVMRFVP